MRGSILLAVGLCWVVLFPTVVHAEVKNVGDGGFQLVITRECPGSVSECQRAFLGEVSHWWLADHTYSRDSNNMAFDMQRRCLQETLPDDGFVRHMEIKQYHPGKRVVLTGGMGPLQEMGLQGAMTIQWAATETGCQVQLKYNVSGYSPAGFQELAPVVDMVLTQQLESYQKHCQKFKSDE